VIALTAIYVSDVHARKVFARLLVLNATTKMKDLTDAEVEKLREA